MAGGRGEGEHVGSKGCGLLACEHIRLAQEQVACSDLLSLLSIISIGRYDVG